MKKLNLRYINLLKISILFLYVNSQATSAQQEPNFTLYNFNMNIINPALAGHKDDPELNLIYRYQNMNIDDNPRTSSFSYSRGIKGNLGIGLSAINDRVFVLSQTDIAIDLSYKLNVTEKTKILFGMKFGGGFIDIDLTKANAPSNDPLFSENQSFFNPHVGAGIFLQSEKFYISFSIPNFLRGQRYEKSGNVPVAAVEEIHYYSGIGYNFTLSNEVTFNPKIMTRVVRGAPNSFDLGFSLNYKNKIQFGVNQRVKETTSLYSLITLNNRFNIGVGYDFSVPESFNYNNQGSLEFIVKYIFK